MMKEVVQTGLRYTVKERNLGVGEGMPATPTSLKQGHKILYQLLNNIVESVVRPENHRVLTVEVRSW